MRPKTPFLASGVLLLLGASCVSDATAPDCFVRENGKCVLPSGGGTPGELSIDCGTPPNGAVGANYSYTVTSDGPASLVFEAIGLPPGLLMSSTDGQIYGKPTEAGTFTGVIAQVTDSDSGNTKMSTCADIVINNTLDHDLFDLPDTAPYGCVPIGDAIGGHLVGGDGSVVSCSLGMGADPDTCPLEDGNGVLPAGLTWDDASCAATGTISEDHAGTYVWMVQVEQAGAVLHVPFCATKPLDGAFHDVAITLGGMAHDPLAPAIITFDPEAALSFGDGTDPRFEVTAACNAGSCNNWGFKFDVVCSPFDTPFSFQTTGSLMGMSGNIGFFHSLQASTQGNVTGMQKNGDRTWVVNFKNWYCTSDNAQDCDGADATAIKDNAQTQYTWSVIAVPE